MPVYQGTFYSRGFTFKNAAGVAQDITGWTFTAHLKRRVSDVEPVLELTSANGGVYVNDGPAGRLVIQMAEEQTVALDTGRYVFDVMRTDAQSGGGPIRLFGAKLKVKTPVTRET